MPKAATASRLRLSRRTPRSALRAVDDRLSELVLRVRMHQWLVVRGPDPRGSRRHRTDWYGPVTCPIAPGSRPAKRPSVLPFGSGLLSIRGRDPRQRFATTIGASLLLRGQMSPGLTRSRQRTASPAAKPFRAVRRRLAARSSLDGRAKCVRAVTECALRVASRARQNPSRPPKNLLRSSAGQPPRERQSQ
jgi:hypothetical protein